MKMRRVSFFAMLALTAAVIALTVVACGSTPATSGPPDIGGRVADGDTRYPVRKFMVQISWWDNNLNPPPLLYPGKGVAATKFDADFHIKSISMMMPTIHENQVNSAVFRLYKWNNSYNATVNSDPIVVVTKRNITNNEIVVFEINEGVAPPGTYLWTVSEATSRNPDACVAVWTAIPAPDLVVAENTVFFYNGIETDEFLFKSIINGIRE